MTREEFCNWIIKYKFVESFWNRYLPFFSHMKYDFDDYKQQCWVYCLEVYEEFDKIDIYGMSALMDLTVYRKFNVERSKSKRMKRAGPTALETIDYEDAELPSDTDLEHEYISKINYQIILKVAKEMQKRKGTRKRKDVDLVDLVNKLLEGYSFKAIARLQSKKKKTKRSEREIALMAISLSNQFTKSILPRLKEVMEAEVVK